MTDSLQLNDGHRMPSIGYGTWPLTGDEGTRAVRTALDVGYRLIDTASRYDNEEAVGRAIADSGVDRDDVFVTTKLRGDDHGYDAALRGCERSLQRLGLDYVDLYLIHWPLPRLEAYVDSWRAFVALRDRGLARSIGVSNFTGEQIDRIGRETDIMPAVNQIELHPQLPQDQQRAYDREHGIVTQSWSPLGRGSGILDAPALAEIAASRNATTAQIVLAWHLAKGAAPIPKSADPQRMRDNFDAHEITLSPDEIDAIAALDTSNRLGGHPDSHEEF